MVSMKIGVYGSAAGGIGSSAREAAREVGKEIARLGHTVVTGACPGLPQEAVLGANELGGECIGFSPAFDRETHVSRDNFPVDGFREIRFIPRDFTYAGDSLVCRKLRNILSVSFVDCGIIVGGRTGTLNEFTLLYDLGKNIGVLENTGGITTNVIRTFLDDIQADKNRGSKIFWNSDPKALVNDLTSA